MYVCIYNHSGNFLKSLLYTIICASTIQFKLNIVLCYLHGKCILFVVSENSLPALVIYLKIS